MFEQWQLKDFDAGSGRPADATYSCDAGGWIDVTVPGDTHVALAAAGRIGHPFRGRHEQDAAWIAEREWCWRTRFEAAPAQAGEQVELIFEGLDTFAAVYLNGALLGRTDNMFRASRFDVGIHLRAEAPNELAIFFAPATASVASRDMPMWGVLSDRIQTSKRNFMRKAQFGWGWDWGPNLPTVGVWQPVRLERWKKARIVDLRFATLALSIGKAEVAIDVGIEAMAAAASERVEVSLLDPEGRIVARAQAVAGKALKFKFTVEQPQLWWTADLGAQPLYSVAIRLLDGGAVLDTHSRRVGIRTIALDQSADPDEPGTNFFRFVLNGVPLFARGACWIPASSFVGVVDEAHYRMLLEQAVDANMNMLRIWGGGVYEHQAFYDLCDQMGLLIWQDFMFACAPYPEDDAAFVDNVREEVRHQVRRLRHHPSLALWCGNNENQLLQDFVNHLSGTKTALLGTLYYDRLMPEAVAELDPTTPYWPGSPSGGPSPNSMRAGDLHNWTVWHGVPPVPDDKLIGGIDRSPAGVAYTRYAEDSGRFISEFGIHSSPALSSLRRWMDPEDLNLGSPGFLDRIKDEPKDKVNAMLLPVTGLPETLEDYADFTMLLQAEGLKFGVEHFRRRKPHCSGTLIWQFNDCWPCVSWSLLDYDGVGKASLYAVKRAYAPVLASFKPLGGDAVELWITNDTLQPLAGEAVVELLHLAGGRDWAETVPYHVPANASAAIWRGQAPGAADKVLCVHSPEGRFPANRHLLAAIKDLCLEACAGPELRIESRTPQELQIVLSTETYLLFVHLDSERPDLRFSDNYFDLRPGETLSIRVRATAGTLSPDTLKLLCWNQRKR
jgi:beta-mannosidase